MDQEAADIMAEQTAALQRIATALEKIAKFFDGDFTWVWVFVITGLVF